SAQRISYLGGGQEDPAGGCVMKNGHRLGRVALALSSIALLQWVTLASADTKQAVPPADVKVMSPTQGQTITLGDDSGKPSNNGSTKLVPPSHTVKKGDTLWDICDGYFGNPWQWPRVWSYNPEILNPHWIYPGEVIRLKKEGGLVPSAGGTPGAQTMS